MLENTGIMKEVFRIDINSKADLYQLMASAYKNKGVGKKAVNSIAPILVKYGAQPYNYSGTQWDGNLDDIIGKYTEKGKTEKNTDIKQAIEGFNMHRLGLDSVPYDDYPALLHEDEAVLSASTANELRGLLSEYRDNQTQNANLEAAIQAQTAELVNKMNEIIHFISTGGGLMPTSNETSNNSYLKNIKSFRSTTAAFAN